VTAGTIAAARLALLVVEVEETGTRQSGREFDEHDRSKGRSRENAQLQGPAFHERLAERRILLEREC